MSILHLFLASYLSFILALSLFPSLPLFFLTLILLFYLAHTILSISHSLSSLTLLFSPPFICLSFCLPFFLSPSLNPSSSLLHSIYLPLSFTQSIFLSPSLNPSSSLLHSIHLPLSFTKSIFLFQLVPLPSLCFKYI